MGRSGVATSFAGLDSAFGGWYTLCLSGESAMKIIGRGTDRLRWKLRIMSDDDLWWLLLNHREECSHEFWKEVETRKAAGILSKDSPFWAMDELATYRHPQCSGSNSNLINLTPEEWEARRPRKDVSFAFSVIATKRTS